MSFPPSFLEEIRNRLPVSDIVGKTVRLTKAGREFKGLCPIHREKGASFYVNDDKQFYHCFGCGAHGDVITFVMRQNNLTFPDTIENLAAQAGLQVPQPNPQERETYDQQKVWGQLLERATQFFEQQLLTAAGRVGLDYFRGRGLNDEAIARFRLGFAPADAQALIVTLKQAGFLEKDMLELGLIRKSENSAGYYSFFRNRVMFPVSDRRGNSVAFGARLMSGDGPKYINSPDHPLFHKGKLLYGQSRARGAVQQMQSLIVVEGYMDVIAMVEAGYSGAVAPLGTAMTEEQMLALWKLLPRLEDRAPERDYSPILCFDGDNAGQNAALRALERALPLITPAQTLRFAFMPAGEDPDSLIQHSGKLAVQNVLNLAKPLVDVIWEHGLLNRRVQTPEDKATLKAVLHQQVNKIGDMTLRSIYETDINNRLSTLFGHKNSNDRKFQPKSYQSSTNGNRNKGKFAQAPAPFISRRTPIKPDIRLEQVILAALINHPDLLHEFGNELAAYPFTIASHRTLTHHIEHIFAQNDDEVLDAEQFFRHLSQSLQNDSAGENLSRCLSDILAEPTYMHAGFARPLQRSEGARYALQEIWSRRHARQTDPDIAAAKRRFNEDPSMENQQRLQAVIRAKQTMQQEGNAVALREERSDET
jgi:DNA primase